MSTQELIELSLLDAMGLLDAEEQRAFDGAFATAAPAVQAHVRREQTRLSHIETLLPDVSPPASLKAAVLDAVRRAMAEDEAARAAGLVFPTATATARVSYWWRAGAIGLATAALFFIGSTVYLFDANADLKKRMRDDEFLASVSAMYGPQYVHDLLLNRDTRRVVFAPAGPETLVQAAIFQNPEWKNALLFCEGLGDPKGRRFKLVIVDENDRIVKEITEIDPGAPLTRHRIPLLDGSAERVAIIAPADGPEPGPLVSRGDLSS